MSKISHIRLPDSLLEDPRFFDSSPYFQAVFIRLLRLCAFKPIEHNICGNIINLEPGQLCYTLRNIANICGKHFSKNHVERAISYFEKVQFLKQEVRHGKTVITITHLDSYNLVKNEVETTLRQDFKKKGQKVRQDLRQDLRQS